MQLDLFPDIFQHLSEPVSETSTQAPPCDEVQVADAYKRETPRTLAELLARFEDAASDHPRRGQIRSSIRIVGRALEEPLANLPADPARLQKLLQGARPALIGIKPKTWTQYKSTVLGALRNVGVDVLPSRDQTPISLGWEALYSLLGRELAIGLSRLVRHFSRHQISPDDVTVASFEGFRRELIGRSLKGGGEGAYHQSVRNWNKAARVTPGWPQIFLPERRHPRQFSFNWNEFPPAFSADVEAFLNAKARPDPLLDDYTRAVRPQTTVGRKRSIRVIASAAVLSGALKLEELQSLANLIEFDVVIGAIGYLRDKGNSDGKITRGRINLIYLMRTIALYWVGDTPKAQKLKQLISKLSGKNAGLGGGITEKNRDRLRQFDIPENVDALISLPARTLRRHGDGAKRHDEVWIMYALVVSILLYVPIRSGNLAELKFGENLIDTGKGPRRRVRIRLQASITKTRRDYEAPLPPVLYPLLDAWVERHRPKTTAAESAYLFPNPKGDLRSRQALANRVCKWVKRETGLIVNLHLFRHIAAKLFLLHNPGGMEFVRQFLGHKSMNTTIGSYAEWQTDPAFERLQEALLTAGTGTIRKRQYPPTRRGPVR